MLDQPRILDGHGIVGPDVGVEFELDGGLGHGRHGPVDEFGPGDGRAREDFGRWDPAGVGFGRAGPGRRKIDSLLIAESRCCIFGDSPFVSQKLKGKNLN